MNVINEINFRFSTKTIIWLLVVLFALSVTLTDVFISDNFNLILTMHLVVFLFTISILIFTHKLVKEKNELLEKEKDLTQELKNNKYKLEQTLISERNQRIMSVSLREMTLALTSKLNQESLLDEILYQAAFMVRHKAASIILFENGKIILVRAKGYHSNLKRLQSKNSSFSRNV